MVARAGDNPYAMLSLGGHTLIGLAGPWEGRSHMGAARPPSPAGYKGTWATGGIQGTEGCWELLCDRGPGSTRNGPVALYTRNSPVALYARNGHVALYAGPAGPAGLGRTQSQTAIGSAPITTTGMQE